MLMKNYFQNSPCNGSNVCTINEKGLELSLQIVKHLFDVIYQSVLMNNYHQDILKFWKTLHRWKMFIKEELESPCNINNLISKDLVVQFFSQYISMISLLDKEDVFDASEHFSEILLWVKKYVNSFHIFNGIPKTFQFIHVIFLT